MTTFVIHFHNLNIDEHWRQVVTIPERREENEESKRGSKEKLISFSSYISSAKSDNNDAGEDENENENDEV